MKKFFTLFLLILLALTVFSQIFEPASCDDLNSFDLATEMTYQIDSRIEGLNDSTGLLSLYSTRATSTGTWTKNENVWSNNGETPLDFSGQSVWNTTGGYTRSGTLISPRHIIFAKHFPINTDAIVTFIDSAGSIVNRTLQSQIQLSDPDGFEGLSDIVVGILNEDVPETVAYYPILTPEQIDSYFSKDKNIPLIIFNQFDEVIIHKLIGFTFVCNTSGGTCISGARYNTAHSVSNDETQALFYKGIIDDDSGNPGFFVINNQPIFNFYHFTALSGPTLSHHLTEINDAMATLQGGDTPYQVSTYTTNCFTQINPPQIKEQTFTTSSDSPNGEIVGLVEATSDYNFDIYFSIENGNEDGIFEINEITGVITILDSNLINTEIKNIYDLNVEVKHTSLDRLINTTDSNNAIITINILPSGATDLIYFYPSTNNSWSTVGNWYSNAEHTLALERTPITSDSVILTGSAPVTVSTVSFTNPVSINATQVESINFTGVGEIETIIIGNAIFDNGSRFLGTMHGNATFKRTSASTTYNRGTITGDANFNNTTYHNGTINGNATFNATTYSKGNINGNATFNGTSCLARDSNNLITGDVIINYANSKTYLMPVTCQGWGTILGTVKNSLGEIITDFNFSLAFFPINYGRVPGNAIFKVYLHNLGFVDGNAIYTDITGTNTITITNNVWNAKDVGGFTKGKEGQIITNWIFDSTDQWNLGTHGNLGKIKGVVTFNGYSRNRGDIIGETIFNSSSRNHKSIIGNVTFNGTSIVEYFFNSTLKIHEMPTIIGDINLNDSAYISIGDYNGNIILNDNSYIHPLSSWSTNEGGQLLSYVTLARSILGTVTVNGINAYSLGDINGNLIYSEANNGVLTINAGGYGVATGTIKGGDGTDINTIIFNAGYNNGNIPSATFNGTSYNPLSGIVGNAIFNGTTSYNLGTIENAVFTDFNNGLLTISAGGYATITGTIKGGDGLDINTWVFNAGYNRGNIQKATFNGTSYNTSLGVVQDATFNGTSRNMGIVSSATFNVSSTNRNIVTGNAIFDGNSSENYYTTTQGVVLGTKTRRHTEDINVSMRNFTTDSPWIILADGAQVTMNDSTKYNNTTIFETENGGTFIGPSINGIAIENSTTIGFSNSDLNILISDQNTHNRRFNGLKPVHFNIQDQNLMSFDFNFSANDLNLARIRIEKGADHLIVDLNGQLQDDQNKTLYLADNNYTHICIKDAIINSIDEISSTCTDTNEYYFTSCINGTQTINGIICIDLGSTIKIEGLKHSAVLGKIVLQTSGGGSCTPLWSCSSWSDCIDGNLTRTCTKLNNCGTALLGKPIETKTCIVPEEIENELVNQDNNTNFPEQEPINNDENNEINNANNQTPSQQTGPQNSELNLTPLIIILIIFAIIGIVYFKRKAIKRIMW